ncbi:MAG: cell wall protein [Archangium sp.]|nr:cell wall protein [Archangium sp.]
MSVEKMLREMVADEVAQALRPVHAALAELQGAGAIIGRLAAALGQPLASRRGPGRPRKTGFAAEPVRTGSRRGRKPGEKRDCAIIDCGKPALTKGYCAAHYQKYRNLSRTDRLPRDWVADAAPGTVKNIALPRGRPSALALAAGR